MTALLIVGFGAIVMVLMTINMDRQRWIAVGLAIIAVGLGSYVTAQRTIHPLDDVVNYHGIFVAISLGDWTWYETVGGGLEFGLPAILHLLNLAFGDLSLTGLLFWLTFVGVTSALAVYAWLIPKVSGTENFALKFAFLVTFVSFFGASHTTRQFLAGVALLPMLVLPATRWGTIGWTALSAVIHTTSLLFAFVIYMCRSKWGLVALAVAGSWIFVALDSFLGFWRYAMPAVLQNKFTILTLQDTAARDVSNIPDLIRLGLLSAVVAISNQIWPDTVPVWARRFTYLGFLAFALLIEVPFVGNRLIHMLLNVAFGIIVMMSLQHSVIAMRIALLVALAYQARLLTLY